MVTYPANIAAQIGEVRQQTIAVLDALIQKAGEFELAKPPAALERYHRKLREDAYKVLVVGEAKRGKSTFVNALIGRDILPTDVDVATSQIFNIRPSQKEAYRLRFEDGSEQEISSEDLPLYSSQVTADTGVIPAPDQVIRWVEIDVPVRFLPKGVSILDMPGLGTSHAGHAQITHRFIPEVDAVIFVLESGRPVVDDDLNLIEEILGVTSNIFFIQTRIDLYNKEDWQDVRRRNQAILEEKFKGRLDDTHVWPVSSTNLREVALTGDKRTEEANLMVSRHRELAVALRAFLFRVAGWSQAAEAMLLAVRYHATSRKAFSARLAGFAAESEQKRSELQKIAVESKRRFEAEWGLQGREYLKLREDLRRAIAVGKQSFANALQMGGDIELAQKAKIDAIKSLTGAKRVAKEMPGEVVMAALISWVQVCKEVQYRCAELLEPFAGTANRLSVPLDLDVASLAISNYSSDAKFKTDYFMTLRGAASGIILLGAVGAALAITGASMPPLGLVAVPVLLVLVGSGIRNVRQSQLKSARQELRAHLMEVLQKVRRHFFDVDLASCCFGRVDEYFRALERSANEQVQKIVEKKTKGAYAETARLSEALKLDDHERDARVKQTREQLAKWDDIGKSAKDVMTRRKELGMMILVSDSPARRQYLGDGQNPATRSAKI